MSQIVLRISLNLTFGEKISDNRQKVSNTILRFVFQQKTVIAL